MAKENDFPNDRPFDRYPYRRGFKSHWSINREGFISHPYFARRWGLVQGLPTSFDNAESIYELIAWLQKMMKRLLDDFEALEAEFDEFKNAMIELLEELIPELIRQFAKSEEFKNIIKDMLKSDEFQDLLEEILRSERFHDVFKDIIKEVLNDPDMKDWMKEYLKELIREMANDPDFNEIIKNLIDKNIKETQFYHDLMSQLDCVNDKVNALIAYLRGQIVDKFDILYSVKAQAGGGAMMTGKKVGKNGFEFHFTTTSIGGDEKYGDGYVKGSINCTYSTGSNGAIRATIKSVTFTDIYWTMAKAVPSGSARLQLKITDLTGKTAFDKTYDGKSSWSQKADVTVNVNKSYDVPPHGSTSDIQLFDIFDNWTIDAHGQAFVKFVNNSDAFPIDESTCGIVVP